MRVIDEILTKLIKFNRLLYIIDYPIVELMFIDDSHLLIGLNLFSNGFALITSTFNYMTSVIITSKFRAQYFIVIQIIRLLV